MSHLSNNNLQLSVDMIVYQIGIINDDYTLMVFKILELLPDNNILVYQIDQRSNVSKKTKSIPSKNVTTDAISLVKSWLDKFIEDRDVNIPKKIVDLEKLLEKAKTMDRISDLLDETIEI